MPPSASLSGLMKWLRRDPWSDAFGEIFEQHLARACSNADIEMAELADIIGDERTVNLWGCAFEDFLTRDFDGIGNIVEDYLKRRGWNEKPSNRIYISGLRSSVMSLYEVSDIRLGESFLARDLVRGGEPVRISERSATQSLKQWDRIAARVVEVPGKTVIAGGVLSFDSELSESLLESLRRVQKKAAQKGVEVLRSLDRAIGPPEAAAAFAEPEVLRRAAPLISACWLDDVLAKLLNPRVPELCNSDGEDIVFLSLHYRLVPGVSAARVRKALDRLPGLQSESPTFWNWLAEAGAPMDPPEPEAETGLILTSTMEDGSVVLGTLELKNKVLLLSVNSESRAERGRAMLDAVLDGVAAAPLIERQTVARVMANAPANEPASEPSGLSREEERRVIHASLEAHYRAQLDQPIPALGNITPRQAAKTAGGRDKLVAWLKHLENHMAQYDASNPMADFDVSWMWDELGVADWRK